MIHFVHTADVHFGVENYGRIDPKTGIHSRLLDFKKSLDICISWAIEQQVDFFLLCGDAYKTAYPTPTQQKLLLESLLRLHAADIPVVIVVGNHDHPLSFGKAHALDVFSSMPVQTFHVFSKPDLIHLETKSGPVQIVGIPWPTRNNLITHEMHHLKEQHEVAGYIAEKMGLVIEAFANKLDATIPSILCGHLTVSNGIFSGSEKCAVIGTDPIFLPSQLAIQPFNYVALGHLHRHQNLNPHGTPIVYAGSIERVDFGERKEEKGFCSVKIENTSSATEYITSYAFHTLPTRKMIQIDIIIDQETNQTEQIVQTINNYDLTNAIVKITYTLPENATDKADLSLILKACSNAHYVVGILPIHKQATRSIRAKLSTEMNLETTLNQFFENKNTPQEKKLSLLKKAFFLQSKMDASKNNPE